MSSSGCITRTAYVAVPFKVRFGGPAVLQHSTVAYPGTVTQVGAIKAPDAAVLWLKGLTIAAAEKFSPRPAASRASKTMLGSSGAAG